MVGHLALSGHRTKIWNRSAAKVAALSAAGQISVREDIVGDAFPSTVNNGLLPSIGGLLGMILGLEFQARPQLRSAATDGAAKA